MKLLTLTIFNLIWYYPVLIHGVFNWDVCQYGSNSSLLSNLYTSDEIKFYCSLNAQELNVNRNLRPSQKRFMPENLPLNPYSSLIQEDNENLHMSQRYRRSIIETSKETNINPSNSIFDTLPIVNGSAVCSNIKYKNATCGLSARKYLYDKIKYNPPNLQNKEELDMLLKKLDFIDFSLYHNNGFENETIKFLYALNLIKWDVEIGDKFVFQNIIWRCSNIFNNFIRVIKNDVNILHILVSHEKIFSNMLHWKILDADYLFRNFFSTLETVYMYSSNKNIVERMNNFIFEISNIVKNNGFWETQYDRFRLYTYINYVRKLNMADRRVFKTSYIFTSPEMVLNNTMRFGIGPIAITIHYQKGSYMNQSREELKNVYEKFLSVFNPNHTILNGIGTTITIRVFKNKEEYTIYGSLFDFSTNNGGITYGNNLHSDIYCYCLGETILNFGHEFTHGLVNTFFYYTFSFYPFIHEGLAEAIGQKEYHLQNGLIENMYKNEISISYTNMTNLTYGSDISVYALGFIVFKTIIYNNQTQELTHSLNTFYNQTNLDNLITKNLNNYKIFANNYIKEYYYNISLNNKTNILNIPFEQVQKAYQDNYPGDNFTIEIDNTYFTLSRRNIYLSHNWPNCCPEREILNNPKKIEDMIYLFSFMISTSVKQIPLFETIFPELLKKKENNIIYYFKEKVTDTRIKERIFNSFFRMGNHIGVNFLSIHSKTFSEVKELITTKHRIKHTNYYKLSIPSWNTTSDIQNAIYNINADSKVDLRLVRSVDQNKKVDIENRDVKEIFSEFFPVNYLSDQRIENIERKTGMDYLNKNLPLTQQFIPRFKNNEDNNAADNNIFYTSTHRPIYYPTQRPIIYRPTYNPTIKPIHVMVNRTIGIQNTYPIGIKNNTNVIENDKIINMFSNFKQEIENFKQEIENKIDTNNFKLQSILLDILKGVNKTQHRTGKLLYKQNEFKTHLNYLSNTFTNFANYITNIKTIETNDESDNDDYSYLDSEDSTSMEHHT